MNLVDLTAHAVENPHGHVAKMMKLPWALLPMALSLLDEVPRKGCDRSFPNKISLYWYFAMFTIVYLGSGLKHVLFIPTAWEMISVAGNAQLFVEKQ